MIRDFGEKETLRIWNGMRSRKLPTEMQDRALDKLKMLNRAKSLDDLRNRLPTVSTHCPATARGSTAFPLICSGVYASSGRMGPRQVSRSSTTTNPDGLHNSHAGELLVSEFMEPLGLTTEALAEALRIDSRRLSAVIDGSVAMDADLDLRLSRYFRMSEGFFLGLQDDYELLEAKRALNGDLDCIVRRDA